MADAFVRFICVSNLWQMHFCAPYMFQFYDRCICALHICINFMADVFVHFIHFNITDLKLLDWMQNKMIIRKGYINSTLLHQTALGREKTHVPMNLLYFWLALYILQDGVDCRPRTWDSCVSVADFETSTNPNQWRI